MKGFSQAMGLAVVTFFVVALVAGLGTDRTASLNDRIILNSVPTAADRVEIAIYTMDAVRQGELELRMKGQYGLEDRNDEEFLNYSFDSFLPDQGDTSRARINPPVSFNLDEEGISGKICVIKTEGENVEIDSGEC
ncbi:hypothetical protein GLU60_01095 [Nanohaloarchaea archaeon H01]|nr:hypothetical protein [Nanohaloarchaea archaeon H01]